MRACVHGGGPGLCHSHYNIYACAQNMCMNMRYGRESMGREHARGIAVNQLCACVCTI